MDSKKKRPVVQKDGFLFADFDGLLLPAVLSKEDVEAWVARFKSRRAGV